MNVFIKKRNALQTRNICEHKINLCIYIRTIFIPVGVAFIYYYC